MVRCRMPPIHLFVERCRRWARLADALEGHPRRDALFQVMQEIDQLYEAERIELANAVQGQALAAGTEERERLRAEVQQRQEKLDQVLAMLVTPASDVHFHAHH
jgi:hypothetical protein